MGCALHRQGDTRLMLHFLFQISDIYLLLLLSSITIGISIIALILVKRYIPLKLRNRNNPVIGNISALIGIIYGVLAGLTALYLFNNVYYATDSVQREANALADIYRDSKWLKEPTRSAIQIQVKNYLNKVINEEWILMKNGSEISKEGALIIDSIGDQLKNYDMVTNKEFLIVRDILDEVKKLYDSREQRISMNDSALNPEVWVVLLIGTILTLGINYLFGMHFYLHLFTVSATALMASSMIFLIITLDKPFQGQFIVQPDSFKSTLSYIEKIS